MTELQVLPPLLVKRLSGAIKAYQDFQKASKKTELRGGVMEGRLLKEDDVKALGVAVEGTADCSNCWGAQCLGSQDRCGYQRGSCFPRSQPEGSVREGTKQR